MQRIEGNGMLAGRDAQAGRLSAMIFLLHVTTSLTSGCRTVSRKASRLHLSLKGAAQVVGLNWRFARHALQEEAAWPPFRFNGDVPENGQGRETCRSFQ